MKIRFNETEYTLPSSLADITLGQRIEFYDQHGKILDQRAESIRSITDDFDRETEQTQWCLELAARSIAYYAGIVYETVKAEVSLIDLLNIYNTNIQQLYQQEKEIELKQVYDWQGEQWFISAPELQPNSTVVFNEFLHAKETVRQIHAIGKSKWDSMPYLCAIYLRRENEAFDESLVHPDSKRLEMMNDLPLDIALGVGFFLSSTLNIYTTISASFTRESQKGSTQPLTSNDGGG